MAGAAGLLCPAGGSTIVLHAEPPESSKPVPRSSGPIPETGFKPYCFKVRTYATTSAMS
jgi:hypothetical protein